MGYMRGASGPGLSLERRSEGVIGLQKRAGCSHRKSGLMWALDLKEKAIYYTALGRGLSFEKEDDPLKPVVWALAALDFVLGPDAVAGVFVQGQAERDSPLNLRMMIKKHWHDAGTLANGLITQVISPTL